MPAWDRSIAAVDARIRAHPEQGADLRAMWTYYESHLLDLRPAIGTVLTVNHNARSFDGEEVTTVRYLDARVTSFHRALALDERRLVLPYVSSFDDVSWAASQAVLLWRSLCLLGAVVQVRNAPRTSAKM